MSHEDAPTPELFVARDRARRFSRRIREALDERRLGYQGDRVGMATLVDHADDNLAAVLEDVAQTIADVEARRIRDRERGFMEVPLLVAAAGVALRVGAARRLEARRRLGAGETKELEAAVLGLLDDALARLDRYVAAYDEKLPVGPLRVVPIDRLLERIESVHRLEHPVPQADGAPPAFDAAPPPVRADDAVLEDLLRAARAALTDAPAPWSVQPAAPDQPMRLALGTAAADSVGVAGPADVARAARVLGHVCPVVITCVGRPGAEGDDAGLLSDAAPPTPDRIDRIEIEIADEAAGSLEAVMRAAAGPDAALTAEAEKAVRALLAAPPLPDDGPPPPMRSVALLGLLRALDAELAGALLARADTPACRVAASQVPRESTRKAPVRRDLVLVLEDTYPAFPGHRVDDVARLAADGKLSAKNVLPADAAALLAVLGRTWRFAGRDIRRALDLDPLQETDVDELIGALGEAADIRRRLEGGDAVEAVEVMRIERSVLAVLGRLGRLPR